MSATHRCVALFLAKFLILIQSLPSTTVTNRPKRKVWLSNNIDISNTVIHYTKVHVNGKIKL